MPSDKFFLFRAHPITKFSTTSSNYEDTISMFAVPTDRFAYSTAEEGKVIAVFTAGIYQEVSLFGSTGSGTGLLNTRVIIPCEPGDEMALAREILEFITTPALTRRVITVDAVNQSTNLKNCDATQPIEIQIFNDGVLKKTGEIDVQPGGNEHAVSGIERDGIFFPTTLRCPDLDYQPSFLSAYSEGTDVGFGGNPWENEGDLGATYHLNQFAGTTKPKVVFGTDDSSNNSGLSSRAVKFVQDADGTYSELKYFSVDYTHRGAYTMFLVIGVPDLLPLGKTFINGDGFKFGFSEILEPVISALHGDTSKYSQAEVRTDDDNNGTVPFVFPDPTIEAGVDAPEPGETCLVFGVRRDEENNITVQNFKGQVIAYIPAQNEKGDFQTSGDVDFDTFGGSFQGCLGRFVWIEADIGQVETSRICKDLYDKYRPAL